MVEARGDEIVPAVPSNPPTKPANLPTRLPEQHQSYQLCISCHALVAEHGRYIQTERLIAMHLAVSTCLVRRSRAFFVFCLSPSPSPVWSSHSGTVPSRQSHPCNLDFPCKNTVQRWDGLLRHGGPLPFPARLLSTERQHLTWEQASGACLLPVLLNRKAHAQISVQYSSRGQDRMDDVSGEKSLSVPMTTHGKTREQTEYYLVGI